MQNKEEGIQLGPTSCLSLTDEMLLLGVVTRASSHPVGSKSFACTPLDWNVGAAPAIWEAMPDK